MVRAKSVWLEHQLSQVMVVTVLLPQLRVRLSLALVGAVAVFLGPPHFLAEGQAVGEPVVETPQHLEQPEQKTSEAEAEELVGVRVGARRKRAATAVPVLLSSASQDKPQFHSLAVLLIRYLLLVFSMSTQLRLLAQQTKR